MKLIICFAALIAVAVAYPAQDGAAYTNEAIRQAQSSHLIPQNAQIQNVWLRLRRIYCSSNNLFSIVQVQEGIELAAYESIPGNQRIDLHQILRSEFPVEVVDNLQKQIDTIGGK